MAAELRTDLAQNVLLCGGSSLFTGFEARFQTELLRNLPPEAHVVVMAQPTRNFSVWIGGSILASLVRGEGPGLLPNVG